MRRALIIIFLIFILTISSIQIVAQPADSPWPMYKGNAKHTGQSPYYTNHTKPALKWKFKADDGVDSSPAIGEDGTIYVGTFGNKFYAFNPDGEIKWIYERQDERFSCFPAIAHDGTIYVASTFDHAPVYNMLHENYMDYGVPKLTALYPNGTIKWDFVLGGFYGGTISPPSIGPDGIIYIGSGGSEMHENAVGGDCVWAIYPNGTAKWSFDTGDSVFSSPAIADDGTIYVGAADYRLFAITSDGKEKWNVSSDSYFDCSPAIGPDGTVYVGCCDKNLYAVSPEGEVKWKFPVNDILEATPSIGPDGTIYSGVIDQTEDDYNLYAINPDGTEKWRYKTKGGIYSTPAIDAEGILYFGSYDGNLYSLNPDGSLRWKFKSNGGIYAPPALDKDGTIYFGNWGNTFYAIGGYAIPEKENGSTPGFEIIIIFLAISIILFLKKNRYY